MVIDSAACSVERARREEGEQGELTVGASPHLKQTASLSPQDVHSCAHKQTQCKYDVTTVST